MLNICFGPYLFLRTPALSYEEYSFSELEEMLKTPFFRAAIFFASESLYTELNRCGFNYKFLDKRAQFSLQKYFNRMCYRPTPFGIFSAFSTLKWGGGQPPGVCVLDGQSLAYVNPDFQFTAGIGRKMEKSGQFGNVKYFSNNAIYNMKGERRYLTSRFNPEQEKTDFLISSFRADRLLSKLITFCKNGKTKIEIAAWLKVFTSDPEEISAYIDDMTEAGLLVSELIPNMTGEKYFERLIKIVSENNFEGGLGEDIVAYGKTINNIKSTDNINIADLVGNNLYLSQARKPKSMFYVGYEKKSQSTVDGKYQEYIKEGLNCLNRLTPNTAPKSLVTFKTKFIARFENQEVPILQALDREAGVGYDGLEANLVVSELLDGIQLDLQSSSLSFVWTPVHELFLSRLSQIKNDEPIVITDKDLEKIQWPQELKTPPGFSVLFRVVNEKIWIEQAGGCTSTALLGRFTLFSEDVLQAAQSGVSIEEQLNKDVIFAEISCFNDDHAANINSNAGVMKYEIPIGVYSTSDRKHIIDLADITVSIVEDTILLRSKKLNKVIIPRLSSAFNYSRSELSLFRFLCDMQYQGLKFNYSLDLKSLLPGLNFYPRVEYKSCILFPATWVLGGEEIAEICQLNEIKSVQKKLKEKHKLRKLFAFTEGDNQLVFDRDDAQSVEMFVKVIKNKDTAILQEVYTDQPGSVRNADNQPLMGQFIASVFSNVVTYPKTSSRIPGRKKNSVKRIYLPGDEWVYLKVYCHPAISNNILTQNIKSCITILKKQKILKGWYFIRYADPDNHLRIRVQINPDDASEVLKCFEKRLRNHVEKGSVNNLLLDTYRREIERYGSDTIEYIEKIFQVSSDLILNYLKNIGKKQTIFSELHLALISVHSFLEIFYDDNLRRIGLLKGLHEGMRHEFEDSKQVKLQMDNKYREYSFFINNMDNHKAEIVGIVGKKEYNTYLKALSLLKLNTARFESEKLMMLIADIIHMHLNRLFNERQRKHEFVIYYMLHKYYLSSEARRSKKQLVFSPAPERFAVDYV